jgi:hypothetical protein
MMIIAITLLLGVAATFAAGLVAGYARRDKRYVAAYRNLEYVPKPQAGHAPALEVCDGCE